MTYVPIPPRRDHVLQRSEPRLMADYSKRSGTNVTPAPPAEDPLPEPSIIYNHRHGRFVELGFTDVDAGLLALAKDDSGYPLYWGQAQKLLDAGCRHAQVVALYA